MYLPQSSWASLLGSFMLVALGIVLFVAVLAHMVASTLGYYVVTGGGP
jgi:uncharacterized membrane protein